MQLSPEAKKVYDNVVLNRRPMANGVELRMATLAVPVRANATELILDAEILEKRVTALVSKIAEVFNECVRLGFLEYGVFSQIRSKDLAETDLSTAKLVYFMPFTRYSLKELNEMVAAHFKLEPDHWAKQNNNYPPPCLFEEHFPRPDGVWAQLGVQLGPM